MDGWSAAEKVKWSHPAAYELAITANLREVWKCESHPALFDR